MPFISKDWRSPGEEWVRYEGGWELKRTVSVTQKSDDSSENVSSQSSNESEAPVAETLSRIQIKPEQIINYNNNNIILNNLQNINLNELNHEDVDENDPQRRRRYSGTILLRLDRQTQPYCPITLKNTREVAGFNELAEAMLRLDMIHAVRDVRRFNYVSKLMFLLFNHDKLSQLPGGAQKILFRMLEEMADTVYKMNQNQHILQKLIEELQTTMTIYHVWGSHLGSSNLFKQHLESRRKITEYVERMQVEFKQDLASPGLVECLPEECIREILLRLSDSKDLEGVARACLTMNAIAGERRIWKELVQTHFNKQQIEYMDQHRPHLKENQDWKEFYHCLRRHFGLREEFTEVVMLCKKCCALFWQSLGHPCFIPAEQLAAVVATAGEELPAVVKAIDNLPPDVEDLEAQEKNYTTSNEWLIPLTPMAFLSFFSV